MAQIIKFSDYTFTYETGTLIKSADHENETTTRLAPQPSKLLLLLLKNQPDMVSHEEIKKTIWPDVHVDYEKSLHFCIRQIRAALQDNATDPKYIQTVPRRGYRWIGGQNSEDTASSNISSIAKEKYLKTKQLLRFFVIASLALSGIFVVTKLVQTSNSKRSIGNKDVPNTAALAKVRIAIMPFQVTDPENIFAKNNIAFQLVDQISNEYKDKVDVIGPTTTNSFTSENLRASIAEYDINYIINGKFLVIDNMNKLLIEIIRTSDGKHVWVRSVENSILESKIIDQIKNGIYEELGI